mmetsp:Transcript_9540/g.20130  ORF Transcript_9540/g.20130 Transcript_9540/m.20130 type:complete len:307 (+) Transcript_9540:94-1014(+)
MEMSKKSTAKPKRVAASPFSASAEREELERAFLLPSTTTTGTSTTSSSSASASHNPNNFVPTAVPITNDNAYITSSAPVAVATIASLPPPPPSQSQAYSRSGTTHNTTTANAQRTTTNKFEKSESDLDGEVIVRTEPPPSSSYNASSYNTSYNSTYNTTYDDGSTRPTAPPLSYESNLPSTQQQQTRSQLRAANAMGAIASNEEMAGVARAQRHAPSSIPHNQLKNANVNAATKARTADEGLKAHGEVNYSKEEEEGSKGKDEAQEDLYGTEKKRGTGGGYEVNEYDVAEYDTIDYDVTEYKSVYD